MTMTWDQLIDAFIGEEWGVSTDRWGVTVQFSQESLLDFARDRNGLKQAQQFWSAYCSGQSEIPQSSLDSVRVSLQSQLLTEQSAERVNSLAALQESQQRRRDIEANLKRLKRSIQQLETLYDVLPTLPSTEQIQWAQAVLAMPNLAFWEIDTTGLNNDDEIIRFTLLDREGLIIDDLFIDSPRMYRLSAEASHANGITLEQLIGAPSIYTAWERVRAALAGRYVLSFNQDWDVQKLTQVAQRYNLPTVLVIGECLLRHATQYYCNEHSLTLEKLCARVGSPLPAKPNQTSLDRAQGQRAVLQAFAQAISDRGVSEQEASTAGEQVPQNRSAPNENDFDPFLDNDE